MNFSEKLYTLRLKNELSQKELADKLGVSQSSVNYWEKGQRIPSIEAADKIANFFDITIESLLRDDDKVIYQNPLNMMTGTYFNKADNVADIHFSTNDYTLDELERIWQYAAFIKSQRSNET